jgi:hypothetical protein
VAALVIAAFGALVVAVAVRMGILIWRLWLVPLGRAIGRRLRTERREGE